MAQCLPSAWEALGSNPVGYTFYFFNFIILLGTQTDRAVARVCQHQLIELLALPSGPCIVGLRFSFWLDWLGQTYGPWHRCSPRHWIQSHRNESHFILTGLSPFVVVSVNGLAWRCRTDQRPSCHFFTDHLTQSSNCCDNVQVVILWIFLKAERPWLPVATLSDNRMKFRGLGVGEYWPPKDM